MSTKIAGCINRIDMGAFSAHSIASASASHSVSQLVSFTPYPAPAKLNMSPKDSVHFLNLVPLNSICVSVTLLFWSSVLPVPSPSVSKAEPGLCVVCGWCVASAECPSSDFGVTAEVCRCEADTRCP